MYIPAGQNCSQEADTNHMHETEIKETTLPRGGPLSHHNNSILHILRNFTSLHFTCLLIHLNTTIHKLMKSLM